MGVTPAQVRVWQENGLLPYTKVGTGENRERRLSSYCDCDICMYRIKQNRGIYKTCKGAIA